MGLISPRETRDGADTVVFDNLADFVGLATMTFSIFDEDRCRSKIKLEDLTDGASAGAGGCRVT